MKFFCIILFLLFSISTFGENWTSISKLGTNQAFQMQSECERVTSSECFDLGDLPQSVYSVSIIEVDDLNKPIYSKEDVQTCIDNDDCDGKFLSVVCTDNLSYPIKNYDLLQVYCSKVVGYEKKSKEVIALDHIKKTAYDAQVLSDNAKKNEEAGIQTALKAMDCGKRVIGKLLVLNAPKNLNTSQIATMNGAYSTIKNLLETGSLETAKLAIQGTVADGITILESDKIELVKTLDDCK